MIDFRLPQASTMSVKVDALFDFILWTCILSFVLIVFGKLFFLFRFWRKKKEEHTTPFITGHTITELSVAAILTVWVMVIFWWGWVDYKELRAAPAGSMEVNIIGKQWSWDMIYPDGRKLANALVVPKGRPVKLIMTSKDVLHSFYVPAFRVKQDVIPNTYTSLWFEATQTGEFPVYCAEYCGAAHSRMLATVKVLEPEDYEAWELDFSLQEEGKQELSLVAKGKELFAANGCVACHNVEGRKGIGPTLKGVFGHAVELESGETVTADANYIRESLMEPNKKIVKGFMPLMPTMKGTLSDEDMMALIEYIKSL